MGAAVSSGEDDGANGATGGFLGRWARLKRAGAEPVEGDAGAEGLAPDETGEAASEPAAVPAGAAAPEPDAEPDPDLIASLPRIEDITADTDVSAFLQAGIPRALRNAALRRAWAADPRIANYLDPARDYFWDWNAPAGVPGGIPGGGGTLGAESVARMLRRVVGTAGEGGAQGAGPDHEATADATPGASDAAQDKTTRPVPPPVEPVTRAQEGAGPGEQSATDRPAENASRQGEGSGPPRPRHGGAMPV